MNNPKTRLNNVIQSEATTTSKGDFLITHAPFNTLYLDNNTTISEDDLFQNYLVENEENHKLIMIQGGNGSGKSHLIRWLKEKYEAETDPDKEIILFISRAHNNLQDALSQLLESEVFPNDVREATLQHIKSSRSQYTDEMFKKLISFKFELIVSEDKGDILLSKQHRDELCEYLHNSYVIDNFLMVEGGPLDRMRARIETVDENVVIDGDAPVFEEKDFQITKSQITSNLKSGGNAASAKTIRFAERLSEISKGKLFREKVASYLNSKVADVINMSMDLKSINFQRIFENLRKDLRLKNMRLSLFVEDINAFTGIDEALMEVLLTDHKAEGNQECCRLMSVVGSTIWFYENKLNSSIQQRITANVYLREGSVIGENNLSAFAARYINAINLDCSTVKDWYDSGANKSDIPVAKCKYSFSEVNVDGKMLSVFPFTETALTRLYSTLKYSDENNSYRTPRVFLKEIMLQILTYWYEFGNDFLANELYFKGTHFDIPNWKDYAYEQSNRSLGDECVTERSILLRVWGNGTTDPGENSIGGVSKEIFEAFGIPFPEEYASGLPLEDFDASQKEPMDIFPISKPEPTPTKQTTPQMLQNIEKDIQNWLQNPEGKLVSHQDLRDWLARFIKANFHWESWGIPQKIVEAYIARKYICIEGQQAAVQVEKPLELRRNDETRGLLIALARWKYLGNNSWEFVNGIEYLTMALSWLEVNEKEILDFIITSKEIDSLDQTEYLGVCAMYLAQSLGKEIDITRDTDELVISLFDEAPVFDLKSNTRSVEWNKLVKSFDGYGDFYNLTMSYFRKAVGGKKAEDTPYIFVDAHKLLGCVEALRNEGWSVPVFAGEYTGEKELKKVFMAIIQEYTKCREKLLDEERKVANTYIKYFNEQLIPNFSEHDVVVTIDSIKEYIKFVHEELNLSYTESDYSLLKDQGAGRQLFRILALVKQIVASENDATMLSMLSSNPYEVVAKYNKMFCSFNKLVDDKNTLFNAEINKTALSQIETYKSEAITQISKMFAACDKLEEV